MIQISQVQHETGIGEDSTTPSARALVTAVNSFFVALFLALVVWGLAEEKISQLWVWVLTIVFTASYSSVDLLLVRRKLRSNVTYLVPDKTRLPIVIIGISALNMTFFLICFYFGVGNMAYTFEFLPSIIVTCYALCRLLLMRMIRVRVDSSIWFSLFANLFVTMSALLKILLP